MMGMDVIVGAILKLGGIARMVLPPLLTIAMKSVGTVKTSLSMNVMMEIVSAAMDVIGNAQKKLDSTAFLEHPLKRTLAMSTVEMEGTSFNTGVMMDVLNIQSLY